MLQLSEGEGGAFCIRGLEDDFMEMKLEFHLQGLEGLGVNKEEKSKLGGKPS